MFVASPARDEPTCPAPFIRALQPPRYRAPKRAYELMAAFDASHLSIHNPQSHQQLPAEAAAAAGAAAGVTGAARVLTSAAAAAAVPAAVPDGNVTTVNAATATAAAGGNAAAAAAAAPPDSDRACNPASRVAAKQEADGDDVLAITFRPFWDTPELHFKLRHNTRMRHVFAAFAARTGTQVDDLRFVHMGTRLQNFDTPRSWAMEDGDIVDVFPPQVGD